LDGNVIGIFINEGLTDIITVSALLKDLDGKKYTGDYKTSVYIIDKIISHLAENSPNQYKKIMEYLIRGNLLGDMRYMLIVKDSLGVEFTRELGKLSFDDIP